ncbi:MAG: hypothetical protein U9N86_03510 [Bacteroidota bacterium]|nr:hypothetical protein [Bacteroidota bacterium]
MRFPICTILIPLTLVFLLAFSACVKDVPPVETHLTATPDSVFPGDTVNLEFTVTGGGLDMDILTLEWQWR